MTNGLTRFTLQELAVATRDWQQADAQSTA